MIKALRILVIAVVLLVILFPIEAIASRVDVIEYPSGNRYRPDDEIIEERGRAHKTYYEGNGTYRAEFVGSPEFTRSVVDGSWIEYGFTDYGDFYSVQHPWSSVAFYDYYTEVWNEEFTEVKIYDDRWVVEYKNKKGNWIDADFYNITRSYETVSDGIKLKRTGDSDIGQREEIYYFRNGSPCKIEIQQTCDEAQAIRFVWKPSGIVADSEKELKSLIDNQTEGLNFYNSDGNFVQAIRWYDEWKTCDNITSIAETHAQGRKATVTFSEFSVSAGETTILDPLAFYPDAHVETTTVDGVAWHQVAAGATWATIRNGAGTASDDDDSAHYFSQNVAHADVDKWLRIERGIYLLDSSGLPDDCAVVGATFSLYGTLRLGNHALNDMNIYLSAPASNTTIVAGDYNSLGTTAYCDTPITYATFDTAGYNPFVFNATGIAAISKTGLTYLGSRSASWDAANIIPPWAPANVNYYLYGYRAEQGAGFKPKLVVYFVTPPVVETDSATGVGGTTATLSGNVTAIGDTVIEERGFVWDTANLTDPGDTHPSSSNFTWWWTETGSFGTGVFSHDITGLSCNTTYFYRAAASNNTTWAYGDGLSFSTPWGTPSAPTNFTATQIDINSVNLTWTEGLCSTNTTIRVATDSCPTSLTDGYLIYDGSDNSTLIDGLSLGVNTYYFSAWGWNATTGYSVDYICVSVGGDDMAIIGMALFCMVPVGLMAVAYYFNKRAIAFTGAGFALVVGGLGFTSAESVGDIYFIVGWIGVGMAIVFALLGAAITEPTTGAEEQNPNLNSYARKKRRYEERQKAQSEATKPRSQGRLRY